ncbi:hypothetical protein BDD12DRAFT_879070 [Trichophaea hybrida]|nr:hypothetical protein BDD12DRAFT_879070 [Trichophaea hybrida]
MRNSWEDVWTEALKSALECKMCQLESFEGRLKTVSYPSDVRKAVQSDYEGQLVIHGNADSVSLAERLTNIEPDQGQKSWMEADRDVALWDGPILTARVIEIVRNRNLAEVTKAFKKLTIKKTVSSIDAESAEIVHRTDKALNDQVAAAEQRELDK